MSYYTKRTDRMDIHIESGRGTILIKQKWRYFWLNDHNTSAWDYDEKHAFHKKIDNLIWNNWGQYYYLKVRGTSDFAQKHAKTRWDVNFDIEWVLHTEHWKVNVTKIASNTYERSKVDWNCKEIHLDTEDLNEYRRDRGSNTYFQYPSIHEFGHSIGNSYVFGNGDEYNSSSPHFADKTSIMNIGDQMRKRHLSFVIKELNTILPNATFSNY